MKINIHTNIKDVISFAIYKQTNILSVYKISVRVNKKRENKTYDRHNGMWTRRRPTAAGATDPPSYTGLTDSSVPRTLQTPRRPSRSPAGPPDPLRTLPTPRGGRPVATRLVKLEENERGTSQDRQETLAHHWKNHNREDTFRTVDRRVGQFERRAIEGRSGAIGADRYEEPNSAFQNERGRTFASDTRRTGTWVFLLLLLFVLVVVLDAYDESRRWLRADCAEGGRYVPLSRGGGGRGAWPFGPGPGRGMREGRTRRGVSGDVSGNGRGSRPFMLSRLLWVSNASASLVCLRLFSTILSFAFVPSSSMLFSSSWNRRRNGALDRSETN